MATTMEKEFLSVSLSEMAVRTAKARVKPYKMYDDLGLLVIVRPTGAKLWRLKYRYAGKERQFKIGTYPETSLKAARARRDDARRLLNDGIDPANHKKQEVVARTIAATNKFKVLADVFIAKREQDGLADATMIKMRWFASLIEKDIGNRPVSEIEPFELLTAIKKIEHVGNHETAQRVRSFAARVFRYAIITGRARHNPATDLGQALVSPKVKHHAAILDPKGVGALLRAIDGYDGHITTKLALQLAPHLFVRPGVLRNAEWSEVDFDLAVWRIPGHKMKMQIEHLVPLSRQSLALLREAEKLRMNGNYIFPAFRTWLRPMSENTLNAALRRMGFTVDEMTSHGFRSTACTLLNESGKWSYDAIERALAHTDKNSVRAAYHRGTHWDERVQMAQWWSDYLDKLRHGKEKEARAQTWPMSFGSDFIKITSHISTYNLGRRYPVTST